MRILKALSRVRRGVRSARGAGHDGSDLGAIPYGSYHPVPLPPIMAMIGGVSKLYPIE